MAEFGDKIRAGGGKVEYIYDERGISTQISGSGESSFTALYQVALSIDGTRLLCTVPAAGLGQTVTVPHPSVLAFVQSDSEKMWGRNCPACNKYFRTEHIFGTTTCPYCYAAAPDLAFVSNDQKKYLTACYDAFAHAHMERRTTSVAMDDITDKRAAWHYSEEKQQLLFKCITPGCDCRTDILGDYGFCPRCSRSNARERFSQAANRELTHFTEADQGITDRSTRERTWEQMTVNAVSRFEALAKHLRKPLLLIPMTVRRRDQLKDLSFQRLVHANTALEQWFDVSVFESAGHNGVPPRQISSVDQAFILKMFQKRHILIHNGGIVDDDYLSQTQDGSVRLDQRIRIRSNEVKRFLSLVQEMSTNLLDNVERILITEDVTR